MPDPNGTIPPAAFVDPQVNLYSADLDASLRFYRGALGFTEIFRLPKEGPPDHVELKLGSFTLGVASFGALQRTHGIPTGRGPPRFEVALRTEDVDGAYGWAVAKGAPSVKPPYDFLGYIHSACVADPDGNRIVFYTQLPVRATPNPAARPTFTNVLYNLYTNDIEKSLQFYRGRLGFTETFRAPQGGPPTHVEMELGQLNLGVSTVEALERDHGLSGGGGPPRGEVVVWVADTDAAFSWMLSHGAPSLSPPHTFAGGALRSAWVGDPDGNPVQLVARSVPP
ncbi:MAG TPA: VOC family protein [Thermoplasmata archaeon]|nr:VOC family protein [Thermoplasmata archaeon]